MSDRIDRLDGFLSIKERDILTHAGKISHDMAQQRAKSEHRLFHHQHLAETRAVWRSS